MSTERQPNRAPVAAWVHRAAEEPLNIFGMGAKTATKFPVSVPANWMVDDGEGGKRRPLRGEKRPLGEFVSWRTLERWRTSPEFVAQRQALMDEHRARMAVKSRKVINKLADQLMPLVQGKRAKLDVHGRETKGANGETEYEQIKASEQVQAGQLAMKLAEYAEGVPTQKMDLNLGGRVEVTVSDLDAARATRLAREAELAALVAARKADE